MEGWVVTLKELGEQGMDEKEYDGLQVIAVTLVVEKQCVEQ